MIDIVVNKEGMLSIVHDDSRMDAVQEIEFRDTDSSIFLIMNDGAKIFLGKMNMSLREIFQGKQGYIVKMDGWTVASTRKLPVRIV